MHNMNGRGKRKGKLPDDVFLVEMKLILSVCFCLVS